MSRAIHALSATDIARQVRVGQLSPVEVTRALLDRIAATEPSIHAWETIDADGALSQARALEGAIANGRSDGLLLGVPLGIKDVFDVEGLPTIANFAPFRDRIARRDAGVVRHLREAGAIILGKTATVQFAFAQELPVTRNPWHADRSPGGSSSGSGAAIAARQVPAAISTETGGSTLRPAAYCGVVGMRPTAGRLSRFGLLPASWTFDHPGFIVRSVADAGLLLQVLARYDARDPYSVEHSPEDFVSAAGTPLQTPPLLAVMRDLVERAAPVVRRQFERVVGRLADAGAEIGEARLPVDLESLLAVHSVMTSSEAAAVHGDLHARFAEDYWPSLRATIEVGSLIPAATFLRAGRLRRRYRARMFGVFEGFDAIIAPTASDLPPDRSTTGDARFQSIWTMFGFPNISIPTGLSDERLPFAMQITGRYLDERRLLGIAAWCEALYGQLPAPV